MKTIHKYEPLWIKHLPDIIAMINQWPDGNSIALSENDFIAAGGNRNKSGYQFSVILKNGQPMTSIKGSAVIRDLLRVIHVQSEANKLFKNKTIQIKMDKNFVVHSRILNN